MEALLYSSSAIVACSMLIGVMGCLMRALVLQHEHINEGPAVELRLKAAAPKHVPGFVLNDPPHANELKFYLIFLR